MQNSGKRFSVIVGFGLVVILLFANTVITRRRLVVQIDSQIWVTHSREILLEMSQTESLLKDAETGQRGFLYTGDPKYLAPYDRAINHVAPNIEKLAQLTADNPRQLERVQKLRSLAQAKLQELSQTVSLYRSGKSQQAKALVLSDVGLELMNDIRNLVDVMGQEEISLEASRSVTYQKSIRMTVRSIYLASAIATLGLILLAFYILREIELRERHARQILEREEWFRVTLTSLGDAVIATDEHGHVTFLNPLAERLTGRSLEHSKGRLIQEVFPIFNESTRHIVENPVKKVMKEGRIVGLANHTVLQHADGTFTPIEDSASPIRDAQHKLIGVVLVFRDATFERKAQEVMRKTEKLAAAARLAATVAHEINNPLEAIGNLIYITKGMPDLPTGAVEQLNLAEHEVDRISHITRQTLGFYRESNVPGRVELPALVESVLAIYSNKFKTKNIIIQRDFGDCPPIQGMAGELKQVVSNLVSNAADAVSQNGTIGVKLECIEGSSGRVVLIRVEDNGPGVGAEHRDRIFEPFFTTKQDVGTGLGLWVTKEIVDRHGGKIEVRSREDGRASGAVFDVLLPSAGGAHNESAKDMSTT